MRSYEVSFVTFKLTNVESLQTVEFVRVKFQICLFNLTSNTQKSACQLSRTPFFATFYFHPLDGATEQLASDDGGVCEQKKVEV